MKRHLPMTDTPWPRRIGLVVGLALLAAALFVIIRRRDVVLDALAATAAPSPGLAAMLLAAVALNVVLSGAMFSILMSRYGKVGWIEMQALIAATTLVNYLPLRPGLLGRVAYHKAANQIAMMDTARVIVQGVALSVAAAAYTACVVLLAMRLDINLWIGAVAPVPVLGLLGLARPLRIWCWAALFRYGELLVWSVRYVAAFALLGLDIQWHSGLALACVSTIATMVPFVSNGLGLREWAIGLVAPLLTAYQLSLGITAELVNRAAELLVITVMGLAGLAYIARRTRKTAGIA